MQRVALGGIVTRPSMGRVEAQTVIATTRHLACVPASGGLDWGDVPSWIASIGTVGTLIFAVVVLRRQEDDRRRDNVAQVNLVRRPPKDGSPETVSMQGSRLTTVRKVRVVAVDRSGRERLIEEGSVVDRLTPGMSLTISCPPGRLSADDRVRAYFTDERGRRWAREEDGDLREVRGYGVVTRRRAAKEGTGKG